ncbi:TIGR04076 family protein [bacterium]|nr:TIGR04076 family protein [bacterium]
MHKWYKEDWKFTISVLKVGDNDRAEHCRLGFEPEDTFTSTYECPVDFCPECMMIAYPLMTAVRSGGDLRELGGKTAESIDFTCPDGVVHFRLAAERIQTDT